MDPRLPPPAAILRILLGHDVADAHVNATLRALPARDFIAVERIVGARETRAPWSHFREIAESTSLDSDVDCLIASCSRNGYLRERALRTLVQQPGRLALAAALLRSRDWVPEVRSVAVVALPRLMSGNESLLWDLLGLVLALRRQSRFHESAWCWHVLPVLARPDQAAVRWAQTRRGIAQERMYAWHLVVSYDTDRHADACRTAILDKDPVIADWAIEQSAALDVPDALPVLLSGTRHPQARIRAKSLRTCVARGALDDAALQALALRFLFDVSSAARNASEHLLRARFGVDAITLWREAVDAGDDRLAGAALALAGRAQSEDAPRFIRLLSHRKVSVRMAALRGLSRTAADVFVGTLPSALMDPSPRVIALALTLARSHGLQAMTLRAARAAHANPAVRRRIAAEARWLGKWHGLDLLMEWLASAPDEETTHLRGLVDNWYERMNASYAAIDEDTRSRVLTNLDAAGERLTLRRRRELVAVVRSA